MATSFVHGILVIGGYIGGNERTNQLELFDEELFLWELMDLQIHHGIEAGFLLNID